MIELTKVDFFFLIIAHSVEIVKNFGSQNREFLALKLYSRHSEALTSMFILEFDSIEHVFHASNGLYYTLLKDSAVQCSAVQCSAVQCSAVQCSAV